MKVPEDSYARPRAQLPEIGASRHSWIQMRQTQLWPPPHTNSIDYHTASESHITESYNPLFTTTYIHTYTASHVHHSPTTLLSMVDKETYVLLRTHFKPWMLVIAERSWFGICSWAQTADKRLWVSRITWMRHCMIVLCAGSKTQPAKRDS